MPKQTATYIITPESRGTHCPTDDMPLWNEHPRVFIEIPSDATEVSCPYCGNLFKRAE